jgi:hypothetical protein
MADDALGRRAFVRAGSRGGKINGVMSENDVIGLGLVLGPGLVLEQKAGLI